MAFRGALLLLAGCGRVGFDDVTPPPLQSVLTLDRVAPDVPLDNIAIPITLDATRADLARLDPATLRFLASDGNELAHQVESIGPPLVAWVLVPHIEGLSTELTVEYGGAKTTESTVFGTDYVGVWHMQGDGALLDASPFRRDGETIGTQPAAGLIGEARAFDVSDCVLVRGLESVALPTPVTLGAWMWTRASHVPGDFDAAMTKQDLNGGGDQFYLGTNGTTFFGGVSTIPIGTPTLFGTAQEVGAWHRVVYTYDGTQSILYVDDAAVSNGPAGGVTPAGPNPLFIGCGRNSANGTIEEADGDWMDGMLDELRIEAVARSPEWLRYEFAAHRDEVIRYGPVN